MKTIAIICLTPFYKEPRVLRTIQALKPYYNLIIFSDGSSFEGFNSINIAKFNLDYEFVYSENKLIAKFQSVLLKLKDENFPSVSYFKKKFWHYRVEALKLIQMNKFDLVIAHGIYALPFISALNCKKVFNAHEYYLRELEDNSTWLKYTRPYYNYILNNHLRNCDLVFAVNKPIGEEYEKTYGIKYLEITNATDFVDLKPKAVTTEISIIHHGAAIRNRQLELMIKCVNLLPDNYTLTLMLVKTDEVYYNELLKYKSSRIKFIEPVDVSLISKSINQFDIGLFILPPVNYNWLNALPNKLFEFIQGRLAIAVSPNPLMKQVVNENQIGIVAHDYSAEAMATSITSLSIEQIMDYKINADLIAKKLNGGITAERIKKSVDTLLN